MSTYTTLSAAPRRARARRGVALLGPLALVLAGCAANSVLALEVGDCLSSDDLAAEEISEIETVECSEPHDAEVYSQLVLEGEEYPGQDAVEEQGDAHCRDEFASFIGLDYDSSELFFTVMYPTEESWDDVDDRTVLCIVLAPEDVTGTLEGAAS